MTRSRDRGQMLVLAGHAGIGKSSLLAAARAQAEENAYQVLHAVGVQAETQFPFAGLHQLLSPVIGARDLLPRPQRNALLTALGLEQGPAPDIFLTGLATLTLLAEAAARQPVVLLVDDLQWLDEPSQEVLAFVARRLGDDAVSMVATIRTGEPHRFTEVAAPVLAVDPVDDEAARRILRLSAERLNAVDQARILELAQGNPLALVELSSAWPDSGTSTAVNVGPGLLVPTTERLQAAFAGRLRDLPSASRDLLLVAASTDSDEMSEIVAAATELAGHRVAADAAASAAQAGLVHYDARRLRFRHPLVRSAIMSAETPGRRQDANLALGAVLDSQPDRQVRFRAAAITGPDEAIAQALEEQAEASLRRGAVLDAVWSLERAARLAAHPQVRGHRLLIAAEHAFGLGRTDLMRSLIDEAATAPLTQLDRARWSWLSEILEDGDPGDSTRIEELVEVAHHSTAIGETDLALNLLNGAALRCWWSGAGPSARQPVVEALRSLNRGSDPRALVALAVADPLASGRTVAGHLIEHDRLATGDAESWRALGQAAWAIGDCVLCVDLLDRAASIMRQQGRLGALAHVLSIQANARVTLGEWARAEENAVEAQRLSQETGQPIWATGSGSVASMLAGLRGDPVPGLESGAEAEAYAHSRRLADQLACVCLARAFSHAGVGRHEQACEELFRLFDPSSPYHHERESVHGLMFLAEAAAQVGRVAEARNVLARMEELASVTPSPLLHVHLLYARAILAAPGEAEELYARGLGHDLRRWPWVRARIELAYGVWLRRERRLVDSRTPLRAAHQTLTGIGARHWAERAAIEFRAAGGRLERAATPAARALSPQELQIARLASEGLSNREIGERLYCSARTVSAHLYHIFPKLEITSRTQLASRMSAWADPNLES